MLREVLRLSGVLRVTSRVETRPVMGRKEAFPNDCYFGGVAGFGVGYEEPPGVSFAALCSTSATQE